MFLVGVMVIIEFGLWLLGVQWLGVWCESWGCGSWEVVAVVGVIVLSASPQDHFLILSGQYLYF